MLYLPASLGEGSRHSAQSLQIFANVNSIHYMWDLLWLFSFIEGGAEGKLENPRVCQTIL